MGVVVGASLLLKKKYAHKAASLINYDWLISWDQLKPWSVGKYVNHPQVEDQLSFEKIMRWFHVMGSTFCRSLLWQASLPLQIYICC